MLLTTVKEQTYGDRRAEQERKKGVRKINKSLRQRVREKSGEE
jgi:hypothetical protein